MGVGIMNNKYSVLMSIYKNDSPEFLEQALISIWDIQTRKPDEIVIVVDGPIPRELEEVIEKFKKKNEKIIKIVICKENNGLGEALKVGTKKCSGNYIFRMDSDDISENTRFQKQIEYIEKHPEIDVLGGNIAEFKNDINEDNKRMRICKRYHKDIMEMGKRRNPMNHVTVCIKKDALEKVGGYQGLLYLEDYYLWLRMMVAGCKFENINENLVSVRVGNGFESRRSSKKIIKGWKVLQDYMVNNNLISKSEARKNMIYIKIFVNIPSGLKKIIYSKFLRKRNREENIETQEK